MLKNLFWKLWAREKQQALLEDVRSVSPKGLQESWYYHIDFGYGVEVRRNLRHKANSGINNWNKFLRPNLPDLKGKRILNIGCNAGLYDLAMIDAGAAATVGMDFSAVQGNFLREWFGSKRHKDYSNASFVGIDITQYDIRSLGGFDMATLFCVLYHLGEAAENVMAQLADITQTVALQGNLPRLTSPKYKNRKFQKLAGIEGMKEILCRHGFTEIEVHAPIKYDKPLVIGRKPGVDKSEQ